MNKVDLGVHTEMFSDGIVDLAEAGAITNRLKKVHPNRIVTSFVAGTQRENGFGGIRSPLCPFNVPSR